MSIPRAKRTALGCAAVLTAAALSALAPGTAQATAPGEDGVIAGTTGIMVTLVNPDGTNSRYLNNRTAYQPAWSPDGSRIVVSGTDHAFDVLRADGTAPVRLPDAQGRNQGNAPTFTPDGRNVFFQANAPGKLNTQLYYVPSDGTRYPRALFAQDTGFCDGQPSVSSTWAIAFERSTPTSNDCSGTKSLWVFDNATGTAHKVVDDASHPDFSPDGSKIAFSRRVDNQDRVFTVNADGTGLQQIGVGSDPSWSPTGTRIAVGNGNSAGVSRIDVATGTSTLVSATLSNPVWQPARKDHVYRVYGDTAIETAVGASVFNFANASDPDPNVPKANVAVLTRADAYYDGLAGSALAGFKNGPMLLTPNYGLADAVSAELSRVLHPGATVYVLGGTDVMSGTIDNQVRALGFTPKRLAGDTVIETAKAIADEMTTTPKTILLATSNTYYDALSAGAAAAAAQDTVVLLTSIQGMPATTLNYLNSIDPSQVDVVTVGGPADEALNNAPLNWPAGSTYYSVVGDTAVDTASRLAEFWYAAPRAAAVATMATWQDALTGGSLIAGWGPVLLTSPGFLSSATADYLSDESASVSVAVLLGGEDALDPWVAERTGQVIGLDYDYTAMPDGVPAPPVSSRSIAPQKPAPLQQARPTAKDRADNGPHANTAPKKTVR